MKDSGAGRIRVANAPCSWGVVEGLGHPGAPGWLRVLDEIAEAGYAGTELGDRGFMPEDPELVRQELAQRQLAMIGAFVPVALADREAHAGGESAAVRTARLLAGCVRETPEEGRPLVILADDTGADAARTQLAGRISPEHSLSDDGWRTFAEGAQRIAAAVLETTGLRTVFHHHCASFVETPQEVETLMGMTSPELLGLCLDSGHYAYGGGVPLHGLRRFGDRVWHVHFKDCDPRAVAPAREKGWDYLEAVRNGVFCGLGEGNIDSGPLVDELRRMGYSGWIVVENEAPPGKVTPLEYAKRDRAYLRGLGL